MAIVDLKQNKANEQSNRTVPHLLACLSPGAVASPQPKCGLRFQPVSQNAVLEKKTEVEWESNSNTRYAAPFFMQ